MIAIDNTTFQPDTQHEGIDVWAHVDALIGGTTLTTSITTLLDGCTTIQAAQEALATTRTIDEDLEYYMGDTLQVISPAFKEHSLDTTLEDIASTIGKVLYKAVQMLVDFIKRVIAFIKRVGKFIKATIKKISAAFKQEKVVAMASKYSNVSIAIPYKKAAMLLAMLEKVETTKKERPDIDVNSNWAWDGIPEKNENSFMTVDELKQLLAHSKKGEDINLRRSVMFLITPNAKIILPTEFAKVKYPIAAIDKAIRSGIEALNTYIYKPLKTDPTANDVIADLRKSGLSNNPEYRKGVLKKYTDILHENTEMKMLDAYGGSLATLYEQLLKKPVYDVEAKQLQTILVRLTKYATVLKADITKAVSDIDKSNIQECIHILNKGTVVANNLIRLCFIQTAQLSTLAKTFAFLPSIVENTK